MIFYMTLMLCAKGNLKKLENLDKLDEDFTKKLTLQRNI